MILVLLGAPGAGKGTQADMLVEKFGYVKLSTGDCLRSEIRANSEVGKKAKELVEGGKLVSDDVLLEIIKNNLAKHKDKTLLLDGYPRNLNQAKTLDSLPGYHVDGVIHIDVSQGELLKRLSGRRVCESCGKSYHADFQPPEISDQCDSCEGRVVQRKDDFADKVKVRLEVFEQETSPVVDFYRESESLCSVDGDRAPTLISQDIENIIEKLR